MVIPTQKSGRQRLSMHGFLEPDHSRLAGNRARHAQGEFRRLHSGREKGRNLVRGRNKTPNSGYGFDTNGGVEPAGDPYSIELARKASGDPWIGMAEPDSSIPRKQIDQTVILFVVQEIVIGSSDPDSVFHSPPFLRRSRAAGEDAISRLGGGDLRIHIGVLVSANH